MRVKRGVTARKKHKKLIKQTKGMLKSRRTSVKRAREALLKSWSYQYRDRRNKKRDLRGLWIIRIGNAAKLHGLSYSKFISLLKKKGIELDRKVLAEIAVNKPTVFNKIIDRIK